MINDDKQVKSRAVTGVIWKLMEKVGMQFMQFVIQIVLARLLLPEDYGIVGLLTIFITLSDVFLKQGFTTALIQKKDADELDFSSVFIVNILMAFVIYAILFLVSPLVSVFYNEERLTAIMRVLSLNVIVGAFSAVHNAIMSKELEFKKSFLRSLSSVLTQGAVGISFAYMGFGVWSLVFSKIAATVVGTVVICATVKWKPKMMFSLKRLGSLFSFSSNVLFVNLLNTAFNNIHSLIIGRYFHKAELGYYQRGQQFPSVMMTAVDGSLNEVIYPTLSKLQDDLGKVKTALRRSMKTSMFLVMPLLFGMMAVSEDMILVLLTEKWLPCVPYVRLSCIVCAFWPLSARRHALNALGLSKITFKLSLISKMMTLVFIFICIPYGIYAIMLGTIFSSSVGVWLTSYYVSKHIHYSIKEFVLDILPPVIISGIMFVIVSILGQLLTVNVYIKLCFQIAAGAALYVGLSKFFNADSFNYVIKMVNGIVKKKGL